MRAEIEIKEHTETVKKGWFKTETHTTYQVYPNLTFSNEEKEILNKYKLWDRVAYVHEADIPPEYAHLAEESSVSVSILELAQPDCSFGMADPVSAQKVARTLEEQVLPTIKQFINQTGGYTGKKVVDL